MSKSKEAIEIEFSKAIAQADELERISNALSIVANSISNNEFVQLSKSWKGSNADAVFMKWKALSGEIFEAAQNFMQISSSIRVTADLIYKAEKAALYLAYY